MGAGAQASPPTPPGSGPAVPRSDRQGAGLSVASGPGAVPGPQETGSLLAWQGSQGPGRLKALLQLLGPT